MHYDVVFFDFDGTLVDSASAKRKAFFDLFPDTEGHVQIVGKVLDADPDGSRYVVIPRMAEAMRQAGLAVPDKGKIGSLIRRYGESSLHTVSRAPEMPGATRLLNALSKRSVTLYLCSNTPHDAIVHLVKARSWGRFFEDIAGHPTRKIDFVRRHIKRKEVSVDRVAFVGDGVSDEQAAARSGIRFFSVQQRHDLEKISVEMQITVHV